MIAAAFFSFAAVTEYPVAAATGALLGLAAAALGLASRLNVGRSLIPVAGALALTVIVLTTGETMARLSIWGPGFRTWLLLAILTAVMSVGVIRWPGLIPAIRVLAVITAVSATLMILIPNWLPERASDIYRVHQAAGDALRSGQNPYSSAVIFESGNPFDADARDVVGYPYPAVPLAVYGGVGAVTDPRLVSAIAWLGLLFWLAVRSNRSKRNAGAALAALVVLATAPIWKFALFMSWTEPLSVILLAVAMWMLVSRKGHPGGVILLGLALASKQYFVFLAPGLVMLARGVNRKRAWQALGIAGTVALIPALFGPAQYFDAVVGVFNEIGFRPDTQSINGLLASMGSELVVPTALWLPLVLVVTALVGWRIRRLDRLGELVVIGLATVFLLSYAFPNYWMLVTAMAAIVPFIEGVGDMTTGSISGVAGSSRVVTAPS